MDFALVITFFTVSFAMGIVVGILTKGIHITINHKQADFEKVKEYNKSSVDSLPPEMIEYAIKNHGIIKN